MKNLFKTMQALCDRIKESGECRDFLGFWDSMCDFKKELREKTTALDTQVRVAKIASYDYNLKKSKRPNN